jgi:hypothetical protein
MLNYAKTNIIGRERYFAGATTVGEQVQIPPTNSPNRKENAL